jgi:hypothetical protein
MKNLIVLLFILSMLSSCIAVHRPAQEDPFPLHTAAVHYPTKIEALLSDGVVIDALNNFWMYCSSRSCKISEREKCFKTTCRRS